MTITRNNAQQLRQRHINNKRRSTFGEITDEIERKKNGNERMAAYRGVTREFRGDSVTRQFCANSHQLGLSRGPWCFGGYSSTIRRTADEHKKKEFKT